MEHSVAQLSSKSDICVRGSLVAENSFGLLLKYSGRRPRPPAKCRDCVLVPL